jgi:hypothetical protein
MDESFQTDSLTVGKSDTDGLRNAFVDIAAGKIRVTD